ILLTSARVVPASASDCLAPSRGAKVSTLFSCLTSTFEWTCSANVPLLPLTDSDCPLRVTVTAAGTSTGLFATRDMTISQLEYCAEDFATYASGASSTISHYTFTGRNNCYTQTTANGRKSCFTSIIT